jgi:hypothetical protein
VINSAPIPLFAALVTFNGDVQERLSDAQTPEAIVAIAADHGYRISVQQLSFFSSRLNGDHWISARKGDAWREGFFARKRQLDLQAA